MLSRRESFLVGLDISPAMISFAKRKSTGNRVGFIVADMVSVPAKTGSFDTALCTLSSINYLRPISSPLSPFPRSAVEEIATQGRKILVVELNAGQMIQDVRLAAGKAAEVQHLSRLGGNVPSAREIVMKCEEMMN